MTRVDMVRVALGELGEAASADEIVRLVGARFGVALRAKFVPIYLATLRAEAEHRRARERAARIVAEEAERPARRRGAGAG